MSKTQYLRFIMLWAAVIFLMVFIKKTTAEAFITPESFKLFIIYLPLLLAMSLMIFRGYLDFSIIGWFTLLSVGYDYINNLFAFSFPLFIITLGFVGLALIYAFLLIWVKFPSFVLSTLFVVFSLALQHIASPNPVPATADTSFVSTAVITSVLNPSDMKSYLLLALGLIFIWLSFYILFRIFQAPAIHQKKENKNRSLFIFIFYIACAIIAVFLQNKLHFTNIYGPINSAYYTIINQIIFFFAALSLAGFSFIGGKNGSFHAVPSLIILILIQQILAHMGINNIYIAIYWLPLMPFIVLALAVIFDTAWFKRYRMLLSVPSEPLILSAEEGD